MKGKTAKPKKTLTLDPTSTVVQLIAVIGESPASQQRSWEVIEFATELVWLASKRGRVAAHMEVLSEKVAA